MIFNDNFSFTPRGLNRDRPAPSRPLVNNDMGTTSETGPMSPLTKVNSSTSSGSSHSRSSRSSRGTSSSTYRSFMASLWKNKNAHRAASPAFTESTRDSAAFSVQDMEFPVPRMTLTSPEAETSEEGTVFGNEDLYDALPGIVSAVATPVFAVSAPIGKAKEIYLEKKSKPSIDLNAQPCLSSSPKQHNSRRIRPPPLKIPSSYGRLLEPEAAAKKSPPRNQQTSRRGHRRTHSEVADTLGVQLLIDTLSESEVDNDHESQAPTNRKSSERGAPESADHMNVRRGSFCPPTIDEVDEAPSETSSISTRYSGTSSMYDRRNSYSTLPTSISGQSMAEPYFPSPPLKAKGSFLFDSDESGDDVCPESLSGERRNSRLSLPSSKANRLSTHSTNSDLSTSSRRTSSGTFFCRGRNSSIAPNVRHASIASAYPYDDDYDDSYYPHLSEIKTKIAMLALQPRPYTDSDDEDEGNAAYLRRLSRTPNTAPSNCVQRSDVGPQWMPPVQRRTRRRTASSECVVLEVLESMESAATAGENDWNTVLWDQEIYEEREDSDVEDPVPGRVGRRRSTRGYF